MCEQTSCDFVRKYVVKKVNVCKRVAPRLLVKITGNSSKKFGEWMRF